MKKPSSYSRLRQRRLAKYRAWRRDRKRRTKKPALANRYRVHQNTIAAPTRIDLDERFAKEVVYFLKAVSDAVLRDKQDITIDFRSTESFYTAGAILVFAELDRIISSSNRAKPITIIDPVRIRPREVMKQIGIHELTGDRCDIVPERDDVVYWKATKGKDQSGDNLAIIEVVAERVREQLSGAFELKDVWRGVSEAMANSVDHAYKVARADGFSGLPDTKWWMFTNLRDGIFTAAVCDLGCGYRSTIGLSLPERLIAQFAETFQGSNKDARAIHAAMEYGRSGTKLENRGKGSRDAMSVLEKHGTGELFILSNTGYVGYSLDKNSGLKRKVGSVKTSILGTIVWWRLPVADVGQKL